MNTISDYISDSEALAEGVCFANLADKKCEADGWFHGLMRFMDEQYPDRNDAKVALADASVYRIASEAVPSCLEPVPPLDVEIEQDVEEYRTKLRLIGEILRKLETQEQ